jgi:hypothetical protein
LAKSAIRPEDAQNPIRHLGLERGFPPSIAAQTTASEFANSVVLWRHPRVASLMGFQAQTLEILKSSKFNGLGFLA